MHGITADSPKARCELAKKDTEHHHLTLSKLIGRRVQREAVTVLPVMVPGGPYFENGESRRRARYAVVTALLNSGWEPADEDKLGYVWTFESCTKDPWRRLAPEMLPWEWFSRRPAGKPAEGLLVLWVDDDAVFRHPLRGMNAIISKLLPEPWPKSSQKCPPPDGPSWVDSRKQPQPWCATLVIGPWTSDGLRGLARDAVEHAIDAMREALADWQGMLRAAMPEARRALRALLAGRLTFTPQEHDGVRFYAFEGSGTISPVIAGVLSKAFASPR